MKRKKERKKKEQANKARFDLTKMLAMGNLFSSPLTTHALPTTLRRRLTFETW